MSKPDRLEGYRGVIPDHLRKAMQDGAQGDSNPKYNRMVLGMLASKLMARVATRDEITVVMANVIAECERRARGAMTGLLMEVDPGTAEARKLHMEGRVAGEILRTLNEMIASGIAAGDEIRAEENES